MLSRSSSSGVFPACVVALVFGASACGGSDTGDLFGTPAGGNGGGGAPSDAGASGAASMSGGGASGGDAAGAAPGGASGSIGGAAPNGASGGDTGGVVSGGASGADPVGGTGGTPSGGAPVGGTGGASGEPGVAGTGGNAPCVPSDEACDGLDNDCDDVVDEGKSCAFDCEGFAIAGRGYMYCGDSSALNEASELCEEEGLRLVWIETQAENQALVQALAPLVGPMPPGTDPGVRIGASDAEDEGAWFWIGGPQFWQGNQNGAAVGGAFTSWSQGRPNNANAQLGGQNCAVLLVEDGQDGDAGQWNDIRCTQGQPFVCETP